MTEYTYLKVCRPLVFRNCCLAFSLLLPKQEKSIVVYLCMEVYICLCTNYHSESFCLSANPVSERALLPFSPPFLRHCALQARVDQCFLPHCKILVWFSLQILKVRMDAVANPLCLVTWNGTLPADTALCPGDHWASLYPRKWRWETLSLWGTLLSFSEA